ncbi:MAG TPA: F0F1 ATP synthase subunit delta [Gammaproteobacteria bacterium]|nr:F0F1 ATP synthase subunit delta [Gammaproteobacteria bacterium]
MAEKTTIARPYAEAVFELACVQDALDAWSESLKFAADMVRVPDVQGLIGNPRIPKRTLAELLLDIGGDKFSEGGKNLIRLLVENGRVSLLPEIAQLFEAKKADAEQKIDAQVTSAAPIKEAARERLAAALEKRLGRAVVLHFEVDESLLGGAVIRAGDLVIDGSVTAQLSKLRLALSH